MFAAYNGYNETVNHLTLRTKNLDTEDKKGNTLMLIYLMKRDLVMINKLLSRGAKINFRNRFGISPILFALKNKLPEEIIDFLLRKGADPHL